MIESFNRFIAFVCPECSGISDTDISIFDFSGDKSIGLVCADEFCEYKSGIIAIKNDKIKISLKCPVCTENHVFTISAGAFWSKNIITFNCPESGITIFFAGNKDDVLKAVEECEKQYDDFENIPDIIPDELKFIFKIFDTLQIVLEEKRMVCKCGSRDLFPLFEDDNINILCQKCKKKYPLKPSPELLRLLSEPDKDFNL